MIMFTGHPSEPMVNQGGLSDTGPGNDTDDPHPQGVKTIVQRESRHWMRTINGRPPFRPDRDLLLSRDP
jgi:hypothetical protein